MAGIHDVLDVSSLSGVHLETNGQVLTVELHRPDRLNAIDIPMISSLSLVWSRLADTDIRVVILTGAGRGFCAGADLRATVDPSAPGGLRHTLNPQALALAGVRQIVIAAVNGAAAGAGLALACAADIRIASSKAKFVPAFGRMGVVPDAGATWFLPRLVGQARATDWLLSGYELGASRAHEWGLVSAVVEPDDLLADATRRAEELVAAPPTALSLTKSLLRRSTYSSLADQLESEADAQLLALAAPERAAARAAAAARILAADAPTGDTESAR